MHFLCSRKARVVEIGLYVCHPSGSSLKSRDRNGAMSQAQCRRSSCRCRASSPMPISRSMSSDNELLGFSSIGKKNRNTSTPRGIIKAISRLRCFGRRDASAKQLASLLYVAVSVECASSSSTRTFRASHISLWPCKGPIGSWISRKKLRKAWNVTELWYGGRISHAMPNMGINLRDSLDFSCAFIWDAVTGRFPRDTLALENAGYTKR
ncbi:hypothetical protein F5Y15DRAFT_399331 [Xylariaceae sp. FL0016]|nr:hypothetical protein F5Y15DRAFT_399331 [Xylariaceae sp. FL0016]